MKFDRQAALDAGYTEAEIDAYLAQNGGDRPKPVQASANATGNFDRAAARQAGYSDAEIDAYLSAGAPSQQPPSVLESAGQIAQQSAAGALTNKIKPMTDRERMLAREVFVDPVVDVFQTQYMKPNLGTLYRVGGDVGLGMLGLPPLIAGTKGARAISQAARDAGETAGMIPARQSLTNFMAAVTEVNNDPRVPDSIKQKITEQSLKIGEQLKESANKSPTGAPTDQAFKEAAESWKTFWKTIPAKHAPKSLQKITADLGNTSALSGLAEAARGPARAIGQRALKYGLGPAGAALTAKDIADAVEAGDYGDAAIQSALAGVGMIPGIGLPASLLGGLGYETYKHFANPQKTQQPTQ